MKDDTWDSVKTKIASAFGVTSPSENSCIILLDAELDVASEFPTLGSYLSMYPHGIGRSVFGLFLRTSDLSSVSAGTYIMLYQ